MTNRLHKLIEIALAAGASDACFLQARQLVINDSLVGLCNPSQCCHYGHASGCPPHVEGPDALRRWRNQAETALAIRIDVPVSVLQSEQRSDVMKMLHKVVAQVELSAVNLNYRQSRGFAGGSCKHLFCSDHKECLRLSEKGICRNPLQARPSMSGFGVDVAKMMETAGWPACKFLKEREMENTMSWVAGLVLVAR